MNEFCFGSSMVRDAYRSPCPGGHLHRHFRGWYRLCLTLVMHLSAQSKERKAQLVLPYQMF